MGLPGRAHSPRGITCYQIDWKITQQPAVTIIIPYHEHVAITRACVEALVGFTDYPNYRIVLVDNWSVSDEALAFAADMKIQEGVSVLRVEEPFNYEAEQPRRCREQRRTSVIHEQRYHRF